MKMHLKYRQNSILLLFFAATLVSLAGCGGLLPRPEPMASLSRHSELDRKNGFNSVVYWRLEVEDHTSELSGSVPVTAVGPKGALERLESPTLAEVNSTDYLKSYATLRAIDGAWTARGSDALYQGLFVAEVRAGEREFFQVRLEEGNKWVSLPIKGQRCTIEAGKHYYLGTLKVIMESKTDVTHSPYTAKVTKAMSATVVDAYKYRLEFNPGNFESDRAKLLKLVPALTGDSLAKIDLGCVFRGSE